jgi:hypothetical protein
MTDKTTTGKQTQQQQVQIDPAHLCKHCGRPRLGHQEPSGACASPDGTIWMTTRFEQARVVSGKLPKPVREWLSKIGRMGGKRTSPRKARSCRENGRKAAAAAKQADKTP